MKIYDILKQEHKEIKILISELLKLKEDDDFRYILVEEIKNTFLPHARAEEATLYNTIRAVDADKFIVAHSFKEHLEVESLLLLLEVKEKAHFDWRATATKLQSALEHHFKDEEGKIFTEAKKIFTDAEAEAIGEAYLKLKPSYIGEGVVKNVADLVINMLPPRLADSVRGLKS